MTTRTTDEQALDETLDETFPASDAPGNTVETGIRLEAPAPAEVVDNREASRFELSVEGQTAVLQYERTPKSLVLVHTEVPPALRGRHLGDVLVRAAFDQARIDQLRVVAVCPFVRAYLRRHPEVSTASPSTKDTEV
jgi:predicted GNAT family acetyltransferase